MKYKLTEEIKLHGETTLYRILSLIEIEGNHLPRWECSDVWKCFGVWEC